MSKVRLTSFFLFLLLVFSIIISFATVFAEKNELLASEKEVKKVVKQFVKLHDELNSSDVSQIIPVYNVENNLESYFVELIENGKPYAILDVGATKDRPIVSEIIYTSLDIFLNGHEINDTKLINIGPFHYAIEENNKLIELQTNKEADKSKVIKKKELSKELKEKYKEKWDKILNISLNENDNKSVVRIAAIFSNTISNFPTDFKIADMEPSYQNNGCGPTAGATIFWYWGHHSPNWQQWYNVVNGYIYRADLQNHMAVDMNTGVFGTTPFHYTDGMANHANYHSGYNFSYSTVNSSLGATDYYNTLKSEINSGRPTGVYIGFSSEYQYLFDYHIMAAYGYYENTNIGYSEVKVATGWGYSDSFDYEYYRAVYPIYFMTLIPS